MSPRKRNERRSATQDAERSCVSVIMPEERNARPVIRPLWQQSV